MIKLLLVSTFVVTCIATDTNIWNNRFSRVSGACAEHYTGENCDIYRPNRHCADLKKFHEIDKSGYYNISWNEMGYSLEVYCDMDTEGGGWTLMSSAEGAEFAFVTYAQYQKPFGGKGKSVDWLGLDNIAAMTQAVETSLRVDLHMCEQQIRKPNLMKLLDQMFIYELFKVNSADKGYSVNIPMEAVGNITVHRDGWAIWDLKKDGPQFASIDKDINNCSHAMGRTGFWFHHSDMCKASNLNGVRSQCEKDNLFDDKILVWIDQHLKQASMWLRPRNYTGNIIAPITQTDNEGTTTMIPTITPPKHMTTRHTTRTLPVTTTTTERPTKTTPKPRLSTPPRNPSKTPERMDIIVYPRDGVTLI